METGTLRAPKEIKDELRKESQKIGISVNALILQILWAWAENEQANK